MIFQVGGPAYRLRFMREVWDRPHPILIQGKIRSQRGYTLAIIDQDENCRTARDWSEVARGTSHCAWADQFDKERGRKLALRRALAEWPRDARRVVWAAYLGRANGGPSNSHL